jgi:hypothetical protein
MAAIKSNYFLHLDHTLVTATETLLIVSWTCLMLSSKALNTKIAIHFDLFGKPNGYRSEKNTWLVSALCTSNSVRFIFDSKYREVISFPKRDQSAKEKKTNLRVMLISALLLALLCPIRHTSDSFFIININK